MARPSLLARCRRSDRGAILVEFALILPLLLLVFGVIVEGGRMMWSYQTAAAGVRDAARYLGRVVPSDLCAPAYTGASLDSYEDDLAGRIETSLTGISVMPSMVTLTDLAITRETCTTGLRVPEAAIVRVDATVRIEFPLSSLLQMFGNAFPTAVTTVITDRTRVFGA